MKKFIFSSVMSLSLTFSCNALAQSAKATAAVGNVSVISSSMPYTTIMKKQIRGTNGKEFLMDVSLECGLYTNTQVKGQKGTKDTATAEAAVRVRVLVDGKEAAPGEVTFCDRSQTLSATLGGVLESCTDGIGGTADGTITKDECTYSDEDIQLILKTMNASSFNFVFNDLEGSGMKTIEVQAQIQSKTEAGQGSANANATIGKGSITIEEVRMIKDDQINF